MTASRYKQQFLFYVRYNGTLDSKWIYAVGGGKLENNKWHHVALCRRNLRIYMYLDGKLVYNGCESSRFRQTSNFSVGAVYDPYVSTSNKWTRYFDGYMQDLRVIKDFAVYTCNFVPSKNFWKFVQKVKDVLLLLKNVCCILVTNLICLGTWVVHSKQIHTLSGLKKIKHLLQQVIFL